VIRLEALTSYRLRSHNSCTQACSLLRWRARRRAVWGSYRGFPSKSLALARYCSRGASSSSRQYKAACGVRHNTENSRLQSLLHLFELETDDVTHPVQSCLQTWSCKMNIAAQVTKISSDYLRRRLCSTKLQWDVT